MVNKKSRVIIAAIATLLTFVSIAYISSCSKPGAIKHTCVDVVCQNGGYCDSGVCVCPAGFSGPNCSVASVAKYIGTWDATQVVIGSDSTNHINDTTTYIALLKNTATPTTFFIYNFAGNPDYNEIVCSIDTINAALNTSTYDFIIDTMSIAGTLNCHFDILWGHGNISQNDSVITAIYAVQLINGTTNRETDTVSLILTPHH